MKKILLATALFSAAVLADENCSADINTGPFLSIGVGNGSAHSKCDDKDFGTPADDFRSDTSVAWKVQGGWDQRFGRFVVGALAHVHGIGGKVKHAYYRDSSDSITEGDTGSYAKYGPAYGAFVRGGFLISPKVMAYVGLGPIWQQEKVRSVVSATRILNSKKRSAFLGVILGMEASVWNNWSLGVSYLTYEGNHKHKKLNETTSSTKTLKTKSKHHAFFVDVTYRFAVDSAAA